MFAYLGILAVSAFTLSKADHLATLYKLDYVYTMHGSNDDNVNWDEAEFKCPYYNDGHLAIIKDLGTNRDIAEMVDAWSGWELWIGMLDRYTSGYWFWNDGTKIDDYYKNWRSGEPNNNFGEDCGAYAASTANWNDKDCGSKLAFICQKEREEDTASSNTEYIISGATPERGYDGTFVSARELCKEQGYRLAHISGDDILEELKKNTGWDPTAKYWTSKPGSCLSLGEQGLHTGNCEGDMRYICEGIHSYDMRLSTTQEDYMESATIKIDCTAAGLPQPNVTWYKRNTLVHHNTEETHQITSSGKSVLVIKNAKVEDTARYRCLAANSVNGVARNTKTYIDLRVHPRSMTEGQNTGGKSRSVSLAASNSARSKEAYEEVDVDEEEHYCKDQNIIHWMLPAIFATNLLILLALGVLMCRKKSAPKKTAQLEFTNAVYSIARDGAGSA